MSADETGSDTMNSIYLLHLPHFDLHFLPTFLLISRSDFCLLQGQNSLSETQKLPPRCRKEPLSPV